MRKYLYIFVAGALLSGAVAFHLVKRDAMSSPLRCWMETNLLLVELGAYYNDLNLYLGWDTENREGRVATAQEAQQAINRFQEDINDGKTLSGSRRVRDIIGKTLDDFEALTILLQEQFPSPQAVSNALLQAFSTTELIKTELGGLYVVNTNALCAVRPSIESAVPQEVFEDIAELEIGCTPYKGLEERLEQYNSILQSNPNSPYVEHTCLLAMARTYFAPELWEYDAEKNDTLQLSEKGNRCLWRVARTADYSPVLFDCWKQWRAGEQSLHYGMSNWSTIPNHLFNKVRRHFAMLAYVQVWRNPDDLWALNQIYRLCTHSNYDRGGPMGHWGMKEISDLMIP